MSTNNIKFINKIIRNPGDVYYLTSPKGIFKFRTKSFEKIVRHIQRKSKKNKSLYVIYVYNKRFKEPQNIIFGGGLTYSQAKDYISKKAEYRRIYISPEANEIYGEEICVNLSEDSSTICHFDYGLLYGNYKKYNIGDIVYSKVAKYMNPIEDPSISKFVISNNAFSNANDIIYDSDLYGYNHNICNSLILGYTGFFMEADDKVSHYNDITSMDMPLPISTFELIDSGFDKWPKD